jgi:hypothetical protein
MLKIFGKALFSSGILLTLLLQGCGGGGGGSGSVSETLPSTTAPTTSSVPVSGGGVKGPLANATVTVFSIDFSQPEFKGAQVATAETDEAAVIVGLEIRDPEQAYILEFTSIEGQTIDLSTGLFPVISTLRTIIRESDLSASQRVYATPVTTLVVDLAILNADQIAPFAGNQDGIVTTEEFFQALEAAERHFKSAIGFGLGEEIGIFETEPLITNLTDTGLEREHTLAYRTVVEALTTLVVAVSDQSSLNADEILAEISRDLADGMLDARIAGAASEAYGDEALVIFGQNPADMTIPNTMIRVSEVGRMLVEEKQKTGATVDTTDLETGVFDVLPADLDTDLDNDGVVNIRDAFPHDMNEDRDTDGDRIGDNSDTDDDDDGVADLADPFPKDGNENSDLDGDGIGDHADEDDDGDGVNDVNDDFPTDSSRTVKIDKDGDGWPVEDDPDDTNADIPAMSFEDFDGDGLSDSADDDDDNDGVADEHDSFPRDAMEHSDLDGDGVGDHQDVDRDGDGVNNDEDDFPSDDLEHTDTDHDGMGNNRDEDDDNDGVSDVDDAFPDDSSESHDSDGDGIGDNADHDDDADGVDDDEEGHHGDHNGGEGDGDNAENDDDEGDDGG